MLLQSGSCDYELGDLPPPPAAMLQDDSQSSCQNNEIKEDDEQLPSPGNKNQISGKKDKNMSAFDFVFPQLKRIFCKYARRSLEKRHSESPGKKITRRMTGYDFIRAMRDTNVLAADIISRSDCDIVFCKWKDATNTLSFHRFAHALRALSDRASCSFEKMVAQMETAVTDQTAEHSNMKVEVPAQANYRPSSTDLPPLFQRLTDPSYFTGSHRYRFDTDGSGKGLYGRDSVAKGQGIPASTAVRFETALRRESDTRGVPLSLIMST
eukprot:gene9975-2150_t